MTLQLPMYWKVYIDGSTKIFLCLLILNSQLFQDHARPKQKKGLLLARGPKKNLFRNFQPHRNMNVSLLTSQL